MNNLTQEEIYDYSGNNWNNGIEVIKAHIRNGEPIPKKLNFLILKALDALQNEHLSDIRKQLKKKNWDKLVRAVTLGMKLEGKTRDEAIKEIAENNEVKPTTLRREYDKRGKLRNDIKEKCQKALDEKN